MRIKHKLGTDDILSIEYIERTHKEALRQIKERYLAKGFSTDPDEFKRQIQQRLQIN